MQFRACGNERLFGAVAGSQTNTAAIFQQTFRRLGKRRNVTGAQKNKLNYICINPSGSYITYPLFVGTLESMIFLFQIWIRSPFFFAGADLYEHPSLPRKGEV